MPPVDTVPPLAVQLTLVLVVPLTVAANCWLFPVCSEVAEGEMVTLTLVEGALGAAIIMNHKALDLIRFSVSSMTTEFLPARARSVADRVTVALTGLTTLVGRWAPFHSTTH